jgi:biopolymer transport protein TolR
MRRARKSINQINVVPYIDVMLVLLVIFMVTAPLINPGVVDLPSVGSKLATPVAPLQISLRADRSLWLRETPSTPQVRISRDDLVTRVRERQAKKPDQAVVIEADRSLRYADVIDVLDILQRGGVRKVGLELQTKQN